MPLDCLLSRPSLEGSRELWLEALLILSTKLVVSFVASGFFAACSALSSRFCFNRCRSASISAVDVSCASGVGVGVAAGTESTACCEAKCVDCVSGPSSDSGVFVR